MLKQSKIEAPEERDVQGLKTTTFFNDSGNVEVVIATGGGSTIVAIPRAAIGRQSQMGDEEYKCLKACKDIDDLEKRLNCITKCPVTKSYRVFIA